MAGEERVRHGQNLILEDRKRLTVSGVEEVDGFDDTHVRMRTVQGDLTVRGDGLHIELLSVDSGELLLSGEIGELSYEENIPRGGLLGRLFG